MVSTDDGSIIELTFGDVRSKRIETPNDFVSHMIEHIAWRLGCSIDLRWQNHDWAFLGRRLGARIGSFTPVRQSAAAQGMLDDGSAEARITLGEKGGLEIRAGETVDLEWFLSLRCEQLQTGSVLADLLAGLAEGLSLAERIRLASAAAALKARQYGGQAGIPTRTDVDTFLREHKECVCRE